MKLDIDCMRLVLLFLEENLTLNENNIYSPISYQEICDNELFSSYSEKDIVYTLLKLCESNFLIGEPMYADNALYIFQIESITYDGHTFLENIRNDNIWRKTKEKATSLSIPILQATASNILTNLLTN